MPLRIYAKSRGPRCVFAGISRRALQERITTEANEDLVLM